MSIKNLALIAAVLGPLGLTACSLDIPDLNNPGLDQLETNPNRTIVNSAATGLLIGNRQAKATTTGFVNQLGILGRESYDFDPSDSRFTGELLQGSLSKTDAFGSVFWAVNYANIRLGHLILHSLDKVADFTDAEKTAIRGFTHTIQALDLMVVILTHDVTGAVIDTDRPIDEIAPFVPKEAVYAEIARLLDLGQTELATVPSDTGFPFRLSPGFVGFDTPTDFIKFNRAIRARIAVYQKDYATALTVLTALTALDKSFLPDTNDGTQVDFNKGVFYVYSLLTGDAVNALVNPAIGAHPALQTDAQRQEADSTHLDARYEAKVTPILDAKKLPTSLDGPALSGVSTTIKFKLYTSPISSIPVIRTEELLLLQAEALYFAPPPLRDRPRALAKLNIVRQGSGKLKPLSLDDLDGVDNETAFTDALLYERRYSLMFEGGHRWIDLRRFGIKLPVDFDMDVKDDAGEVKIKKHVRNVHYPVPLAECDARPGEPACAITSQQGGP